VDEAGGFAATSAVTRANGMLRKASAACRMVCREVRRGY
jgi:hypothetical protein